MTISTAGGSVSVGVPERVPGAFEERAFLRFGFATEPGGERILAVERSRSNEANGPQLSIGIVHNWAEEFGREART